METFMYETRTLIYCIEMTCDVNETRVWQSTLYFVRIVSSCIMFSRSVLLYEPKRNFYNPSNSDFNRQAKLSNSNKQKERFNKMNLKNYKKSRHDF